MEKQFLKGNEAIAEAAVRAGCRFFAGYPITPQNEIPEYMSRRLPEVGGAFVQAESEVAAINMVYGSASVGTLAMTSSSGIGISLKAEGISNCAGAQLPAVIVNVSRGGPGLGAIQPAQADYLQATKALGHGGFRALVFAPANVQEAVDLTYYAFECAEKYHGPVMVLADGCIGSMMEPVILPEQKTPNRIKYAGWGAKYLNPTSTDTMVVTSCLNEPEYEEYLNIRLKEMYEGWKKTEVKVEEYMIEDAEYVIASYGTSARICKTAIRELREKGIKIGMIRPITLYPFGYSSFEKLDSKKVKCIFDVEMSIPAQMVDDVKIGVSNQIEIKEVGRSGGVIMTNEDVVDGIMKVINGEGK